MAAAEVAAHIAAGIRCAVPEAEPELLPVADGGEGTLDAACRAGYRRVHLTASGPTGEQIDTAYALRLDRAVVELVAVCGWAMLPAGRADPLGASSQGLGEVLTQVLDAGCRHVVLAVGGSCSSDGGAGLLRGLGARLFDQDGRDVVGGGGQLWRIERVELGGLHPGLAGVDLVLASDVDNPLLGPQGAARAYAPQKGADAAAVDALEQGLMHWADVVAAATSADHREDVGAGAAGGVGFAALAVLGARRRSGGAVVLDLVGFDRALRRADLVVTGEGRIDDQTLRGKAPGVVAARARAAGVPVVAVGGQVELSARDLAAAGFGDAYALAAADDAPKVLERAIRDPGPLLERVGARLAREHLPPPVG